MSSALDEYWKSIEFREGGFWRKIFPFGEARGREDLPSVSFLENGTTIPFGEEHWKKQVPGVQFADAALHDAAVALMHVPGRNLTYCQAVREVFNRRAQTDRPPSSGI